MATGTILTIANRALASIGARTAIQSLNENSAEAINVNIFYQSTFESLARTAKWNCLNKQAQLTLLAAAAGTPENPTGAITPYPPNPWRYSYLVPGDSVMVIQLVPPPPMLQGASGVPIFPVNNALSYPMGNRQFIPFKVAYGQDQLGNPASVIYTNLSGAQAIYNVNQPNPAYWDSLFQQADVAALGAFLVPALALDKALMQMQISIADRLIAQARASDGNESLTTQERTASWISARSGESGLAGVGFNGPFLNFESMPWPG